MSEIYIIFDGPPSHESGRFVEVEDGEGHGLGPEQTGAGWKQREEFWALGPFASAPVLAALKKATARLRGLESHIETDDLEAYINERRAADALLNEAPA